MNIALMTWFEHHNYGTALQLVALNHLLSKNHNVDVVNYHTRAVHTDIKDGILSQIIKRYSNYKRPKYDSENRKNAFKGFLSSNLTFTDRCDILSDLELLNDKYDCFICGSDQIWNPARFDSHYYLDYVRQPEKMIAYAPSLGVSALESDAVKEKVKQLVSRFLHLSVREKKGAELLSELTGKDVATVLDPTLLLSREEWDSLIGEYKYECDEYVLVYMLGDNKVQWKIIDAFVKEIGIQQRIIPVYQKDINRDGCIEETVGPEEFIALIKNAKYVLTDSFHGMIFSIIYNKPFGAFERFSNSDRFNQNTRVHNLLDITDLKSRLITNTVPLEPIDYFRATDLLNKEKQSSMSFLSNAIEDVKAFESDSSKKRHIRNQIDLCCGCGVCKQVCPSLAITMIRNKKGFYEAVIDDDKCISCEACQKVCPLINNKNARNITEGELYSYKDDSSEVLKRSSSGGTAFAIGKIALCEGHSVLGCTFNKDNQEAEYIKATSETELNKTQGSKYMQSSFEGALLELKDKKQYFYVFGLPCQIAAARKLHGEKATYIDLICHGVPTYNLFRMYQKYVEDTFEIDSSKMDICFRDKSKGWRERYLKVADSKKEVIASQHNDPYYLLFESGLCYAKSCYECPWRDKSMADIRLGDYWGPRYSNDSEGVSMVLSLTEKGAHIVEKLGISGKLEKTENSDILKWQQSANKAEPLMSSSLIEALSDEHIAYEDLYMKYISPFKKSSIRQKRVNQLINMGKRIIQG